MQQQVPSGEEVAVVMPVGFVEGVAAVLVLQDGLAAELLVAAPLAVDEVGDVVDIGTDLEGGLAAAYVEVELLVDTEVDAVGPGAEGAVAEAVFATMCAEVLVASDEGLVGVAVGIVGKGHGGEFFLSGDIDELGGADAGVLVGGHQVGVTGLVVAAHIADIGAFVEEAELGGGVGAFVDAIADTGNETVGGDIVGVAEFGAVVAVATIELGDVVDLVAGTVGDGHAEAVGVGSHEVEAPCEVLAQLCGDGEVLAVEVVGVEEIVAAHLTAGVVADVLADVGVACFGLAGEGHIVAILVAEGGGYDFVEVVGVDAFEGSLDAEGELGIDGSGGLPAGGHAEVLSQDGGGGGSCEVLLVEGVAFVDAVDDVGAVGSEGVHLLAGLEVGDVLVLEHVGVASGTDEPDVGDAAGEEAGTAADDELTILGHVPVEADTGREVDAEAGEVVGAEAGEGAVGVGSGDVGEVLVEVVVAVEADHGHFNTQTGGELKVFAELHLVLCVEGGLVEVDGGIDGGGGVVEVGVGDHHREGQAAILEGLPGVEDVPAGTALHEAVDGSVGLILRTGDDVVDAGGVGDLVGEVVGVDATGVHVGEGVDTEGGVEGILGLAVGVLVGLEDVDRGEEVAVVGTGFVLVGPSGTEGVGTLAAEDTAVQFSCQGGEVLLLVVAGRLEVERVFGLTALTVAVEGVVGAIDVDGGVGAADGAHGRGGLIRGVGVGVAETEVEVVVGVDVPV